MQETQSIRLLALDFDGVIADSILECAVAGYNAFSHYYGQQSVIKSTDEIPIEMNRKFIQARPYIRSGEDYVYLYQAFSEGRVITSQATFDEFRDCYLERKTTYYTEFYHARDYLFNINRSQWMLLNPFFPEITEFIKRVAHWSGFYVVSTKATEYINELLNFNGIPVDQGRIRQAGLKKSKPNIICELLDELKALPEEAYFIDDHPDTVKKVVTETGVFGLVATWGYNNPKQRYASSGKNISFITIKEFLTLFRELPL